MTASDAVVVAYLEPLIEEVGVWCDRCLLPAGARVLILALLPSGVLRMGRMTHCESCDS